MYPTQLAFEQMLPRRIIQIFAYALIVVGIIFRITVCFQHNPTDYLFSDPRRHWLNGGRLFAPDFMGASDPIAYQLYVATIRVVTSDNAIFLAIICAILSIVMPWTYYRAARELRMRRIPSLFVWALIGIAPSLFTIYHYFMMETLLLPLVGSAFWMSARHLRKGGRSAFLWASLFWVLACLTKPTIGPLAALCLGWTWWMKSRRISDGIWAAALTLVLLLPNTLRTQHFLGFPAPLGNPWLTKIQHRSGDKAIRICFGSGQWNFSSPSCYMQPLEPLSFWAMRRAWDDSVVEVSINPKNGSTDWQTAYCSLETNLKDWFFQLGENILIFLFAASWPDNNTNEWDGLSSSISRWLWAPLIFFVLDCNIREFLGKRLELLPVAVTMLTLFLTFQNVATSEGRYRKPLEPLLLMNLVWTISSHRKGETP